MAGITQQCIVYNASASLLNSMISHPCIWSCWSKALQAAPMVSAVCCRQTALPMKRLSWISFAVPESRTHCVHPKGPNRACLLL